MVTSKGVIHLWHPQKGLGFERLTAPPCGHPHAVNMEYTSLSWNSEYNDLGLKLKFDYSMIVIYYELYYF